MMINSQLSRSQLFFSSKSEIATDNKGTNTKTNDQLIECKVIVSGQVQGPFYRTILKNEAKFNRKVNGYLNENIDGTSCVILQGKKSKIESFVRWMKKGPGLGQAVNIVSVVTTDIKSMTVEDDFIETCIINKDI